jgi:hypothetical protein
MPEGIPIIDTSKLTSSKQSIPTKIPTIDTSKLTPGTYDPRLNMMRGFDYDTDVNRYKRHIDDIYPRINHERQAAGIQSTGAKFGNMAIRGVVGEVGVQGIIGGIGSILGLPKAILDEIGGKDADFNNFITQFSNNLAENINKKAPIFRYNPGKAFDWKDWGWYADSGVSMFSTLGMLIPALTTVKGANYVSKGLNAISTSSKVIKPLGKLAGKSAAIFNMENQWTKLIHSSLAMRNAENFRESNATFLNTQKEIYDAFKDDAKYEQVLNSPIGQEFLAEGREANKEELSNFIASKAAWKNYGTNAMNLVFDMAQLAPLIKPFRINTRTFINPAKVAAAEAKAVGKEISRSALIGRNIILGSGIVVGEQLTEGVEEFINAVSEKDALYYARSIIGTTNKLELKERLNEYLHDPSNWEQAFWGIFGGVAFSGATRGYTMANLWRKGVKDPFETQARVNEVEGRAFVIQAYNGLLKKIEQGIDPNTNAPFTGTPDQIVGQKHDATVSILNRLGYDLGKAASEHGNVNGLLDMLAHPNFAESMIKQGLATEETIHGKLDDIRFNVLEAEHVYNTVHNRISKNVSNGNIVNIIASNAVSQKSVINYFTKLKEGHTTTANELRANNPVFDSLLEKYKDKDFEGSINNMINAASLSILSEQIEEVKQNDNVVGEALERRLLSQLKELETAISNSNLAPLEASEIDQIVDYINEAAAAHVYEMLVGANTDKFATITNAKTEAPRIEKLIKEQVQVVKDQEYGLFKAGILKDSTSDKIDTEEDLNKKITLLEEISKEIDSDVNRYSIKKTALAKNDKVRYKTIVDSRIAFLRGKIEKQRHITDTNNARIEHNAKLVASFNAKMKDTAFKINNAVYTGKYNLVLRTKLNGLESKVSVPKTGNALNNFEDFVKGVDIKKQYQLTDEETASVMEGIGVISKALSNSYSELEALGRGDELITELLLAIGYIDENVSTNTNVSNPHLQIANEFAEAKNAAKNENDSIKNAIDFTGEGSINIHIAKIADKWITDIINSGAELASAITKSGTPRKNITVPFELIAKQYARLVGEDNFRNGFNDLKEAYELVAGTEHKRILGETTYSFISVKPKSIRAFKTLKADDILSEIRTTDYITELQNSNSDIIEKTGGVNALNIYLTSLLDVAGERNENGQLVVSNEVGSRLEIILNQIYNGSPIKIQVNQKYEGQKGFTLNKDNLETVPISVTLLNQIEGKENNIELGAILPTEVIHDHTKYEFKGKDWFDYFVSANRDIDGSRIANIAEIYQFLRDWYSVVKTEDFGSETELELYDTLIKNDYKDVIRDLIDSNFDLHSIEAKKSLRHMLNVMMFGENIRYNIPDSYNHSRVSQNIRNWRDKLYRDHINILKIRKELNADINKTLDSTIAYHTSGTIVKSKDKAGNVVYNNVRTVNKGDFRLFIVKSTSGGSGQTVLMDVNNSNNTISKPVGTGTYNSAIYVGVRSNSGTEPIPVPLFRNTLAGTKMESSNAEFAVEETFNLIKAFTKAKRDAFAAGNAGLSEIENKNRAIADNIKDHQLSMFLFSIGEKSITSNTPLNNKLIVGNNTVRFISSSKEGIPEQVFYNFYKQEYYIVNSNGKQFKIDEAEFKERLSKLERNIDYNKFNTGEITIGGITYNSYEDYLVDTNSIITDIGQVVNEEGKFISHFMPRNNDSNGGMPLVVNIDTSNIVSKVIEKSKFQEFTETVTLDNRYTDVLDIINSTLSGSRSKFIGIVTGQGTTATGEKRFGGYNPLTGEIFLTEHWVQLYNKDKTSATFIVVHEMLHGIIGILPTNEQTALRERLNEFKKSILSTTEYKALVAKTDKTKEEKAVVAIINSKDVEELITYGLTDTNLARFLNTIIVAEEFEQDTTTTLWNKLKEIIKSIIHQLGLPYNKYDELVSILNNVTNAKIDTSKIIGKTDSIQFNPSKATIKPNKGQIPDSGEIVDLSDLFDAVYASSESPSIPTINITINTTGIKSVEEIITEKISANEIVKICS